MKFPATIDELDLLNPENRMPDGALAADYELLVYIVRRELIDAESSADKAKWARILKDLHQFLGPGTKATVGVPAMNGFDWICGDTTSRQLSAENSGEITPSTSPRRLSPAG